jgi:hypothetical protein
MLLVGLLMGSALVAPDDSRGEESCQLGQTRYPSNAVVCSGGLVLYCSNGIWQDNGGQRCDTTDGSYLTPLRPYQEKSNEPIPEFYKEKYPWLHLQ